MKFRIFTIMLAASLCLVFCSKKNKTEESVALPTDLIVITNEQFENGRMELGKPEKRPFDETVKCNGNIAVDPSGKAKIGTPIAGLVRKINCIAGEKISAGKVLFEFSGNEFIELQKDLAETSSQLKRSKTEYERIKTLYGDKIGSEKDLIMAETEYKATNARYSALRMKIRLIGLDAASIEEGDFYESFLIKSPISGYVSQINVSIGEYADQQTHLTDVLDLSRLQLKLAVFEKDISRLKVNQKITFNLAGDPAVRYGATLKSAGRNVDDESKSITCLADIDDLRSNNFVNNTYVEAVIFTDVDTVYSVPEESVLRSGGSSYILSLVKKENNSLYLKKIQVDIGRIINGYAELRELTESPEIITKGAYNIRIE